MRTHRLTSIRLSALALCLGGCGAGVDGNYEPAYASISGTIEGSGVAIPQAPIHVALLYWTKGGHYTADHEYAPNRVAQDVAVEAKFPIQFKLDITELPPADAIYQTIAKAGIPDLSYAVGFLVAYADNNGNGKLDLVDAGGQSPDTILARRADLAVYYLASGQPADDTWLGYLPTAAGFSIVQMTQGLDPPFGECDGIPNPDTADGQPDSGIFREPCFSEAGNAALVSNSDVVLELSSDPVLQDYACREYVGEGDWSEHDLEPLASCEGDPSCGADCWGFGCGVVVDLPPPGTAVECSAGDTQYQWKSCAPNAELCGTVMCHFGHGMLPAGTSPPASWPCPTK